MYYESQITYTVEYIIQGACVCASSTPLIQGLDFVWFFSLHILSPIDQEEGAPSYEAVQRAITFLALCETLEVAAIEAPPRAIQGGQTQRIPLKRTIAVASCEYCSEYIQMIRRMQTSEKCKLMDDLP